MKKIYVGNLSLLTSGAEVQAWFESYGKVFRAGVLHHPETGESKGFGYVLMKDDHEANAAIQDLNGKTLNGRRIDVQEALPPEQREAQNKNFHGRKLRAR